MSDYKGIQYVHVNNSDVLEKMGNMLKKEEIPHRVLDGRYLQVGWEIELLGHAIQVYVFDESTSEEDVDENPPLLTPEWAEEYLLGEAECDAVIKKHSFSTLALLVDVNHRFDEKSLQLIAKSIVEPFGGTIVTNVRRKYYDKSASSNKIIKEDNSYYALHERLVQGLLG